MAQQVIFLGTNANDGTGETLRGAGGMVNNMFTELYALQSQTINAGAVVYDSATVPARLNLAIADAVATGKTRVFVPATHLPYDATAVAFNSAIQMTREGGSDDVYDWRAYGAAGDGLVVDTTAIQAALTGAAAAGGISYGPPGYYLTGQLTVGSLVIFRGAGRGTCNLQMRSGTNAPLVLINGSTDVIIEALSIAGNSAGNTAGHGIHIGGAASRVQVRDVRITDCKDSGVRLDGTNSNCGVVDSWLQSNAGRGIHATPAFRGIFSRNTVTGNGSDGIDIDASSLELEVTDNFCFGNSRHGVFVEELASQIIVKGNICRENLNDGIDINLQQAGTMGSILVAHNLCWRNHRYGIRVAANVASAIVEDVQVVTNQCVENSFTATGTWDGINFHAAASATLKAIWCDGNICSDRQGSPTQRVGISQTGTGTVNFDVLTGPNNLLRGNTVAPWEGALRQEEVQSITLGAGNTNDYDSTTTRTFYFTPDAAGSTLTGLGGGFSGRKITIINAGATTLTLAHQDANSASGNRFIAATGASISLTTRGIADVLYDVVNLRWRIVTVTV